MPILEKNEKTHYEKNGLLAVILIGSNLMSKFMNCWSQIFAICILLGSSQRKMLTHGRRKLADIDIEKFGKYTCYKRKLILLLTFRCMCFWPVFYRCVYVFLVSYLYTVFYTAFSFHLFLDFPMLLHFFHKHKFNIYIMLLLCTII